MRRVRRRRKKTGLAAAWEKFHAVLHALLPDTGFRLEEDAIWKCVLCCVLVALLALLQTTLFARFRPFGAIPDLMLPFVVAFSMREGERWGAAAGLAAAFVIEALGSSGITLLPLLYVPVGYLCPIVTRLYLRDSIPVRLIYTAASGVGRAVFTLLYLAIHLPDFSSGALFGGVVLPEYASTFLLAMPVHLLVWLLFRPFHKPRSERVETL